MYEFKQNVTLNYQEVRVGTGEHGAAEAIYSAAGMELSAVMIGLDGTGAYTGLFVMASKEQNINPYDPKYIYLNGTFQGIESPEKTNTVTNDNTYWSQSFWITETDAQNTFVYFYNETFGTTKTRQEIFAELQEVYGDDYTFFALCAITGQIPDMYRQESNWIFDPQPDETTFDMIGTNSVTGFTIDGSFEECFQSFQAIDPEVIARLNNWNANDRVIGAAIYFLTSPEPGPSEKLIFDVYVDGVIGEKGPNIQIKWRNDNPDTSMLAPALIKPHIYGAGVSGLTEMSGTPVMFLHYEDGIVVPNLPTYAGGQPCMYDGFFNFEDDGYFCSYVGASNVWYSNVSDIVRVTNFGVDMIPIQLVFLLRFEYLEETGRWGDLYYVYIPYNYQGAAYCEKAQIADSSNAPSFATEVNIIGGTPPGDPQDDDDDTWQGYGDDDEQDGDGPYPDPGDQPDLTDYDSTGYPGEAVLTKTYKVTKERLQNVGAKLWTQSYFDVLKVQSNPIENIIACRWYPMDITGGSDEDIVVGDVNLGVYGSPIPTTYRKVIGTYTYKGVISTNGTNCSPGYLALSPYTIVKLHLPYVGTVQLDASEIYERLLTVEYIVDIITGDILVLLKLGSHKEPYMSLSGKMGVDIPLSGTDRAQVQIAAASRAVTAVAGAAGHLIAGNAGKAMGAASGILTMAGMDYTTQRVIQHSSVCASYDNRAIVLEMQINKNEVSDGYTRQHGLPSHQYMKLKRGMGFVQVAKRTIIDVAMTDEENGMLEEILTSGCFF